MKILMRLYYEFCPIQGCRSKGGQGGPDFGRSAILTRGVDYAHPVTTCPPPGFSDLPTALGLPLQQIRRKYGNQSLRHYLSYTVKAKMQ